MLEAKLLAGRSGYDVVAPTGYFLERQIKAKIFQPLDKSKLPNLVHLWPEVSQRLAKYDPGNLPCRELHVGHDRHRLQRRARRAKCSAPTPRSTAGTSSSSRRISRASRIAASTCWTPPTTSCRRRCAISASIPNSTREADLQKASDLRDDDPAAGAQVSLVRISQCARDRRDLLRGRVLRRRQAGAEARGRGQERHRDRLFDPERGRAALVRQSRDPARRQERRGSARVHQFPADARRSPRAIRISSPTPTAISRARNSSTRKSWRTGRSIRMPS